MRGFQGHTLAELAADSTVVATAKHFAGYGFAEGGRDYNTTDLSERTLREVVLPPFRAAVDAGAQTLMSAFNEIGGDPATADRDLFTGVLRDEWGFDGFVIADYTAVQELMPHGVAATPAEAGRRALAAGVDMSMVDGIYSRDLPALVASGALPVAVVDEAVRRVLRVKRRAGLFDDPFRYSDAEKEAAVLLADAHRAIARDVARQSVVLLKNDGDVLPLSRDLGSVAVIGALAADSVSAMGSWAGAGRWDETTPILPALRAAMPGTEVRYAPGYPAVPRAPFLQMVEAALSPDTSGHAEAVRLAQTSDAVVLVLGEHRELTGEAASRTDTRLPGAQLELARRVVAAAGDKPVAVVLTNGRPLALGRPRRGRPVDPGGVAPRHRDGAGRRRRAPGAPQPRRQAAGHVPPRHGPGAALLQPEADGPPARRPRRQRQVRLALPRRARRAAVPVRAWTELHDVPVHPSRGVR